VFGHVGSDAVGQPASIQSKKEAFLDDEKVTEITVAPDRDAHDTVFAIS
jgi:hypothetical protein